MCLYIYIYISFNILYRDLPSVYSIVSSWMYVGSSVKCGGATFFVNFRVQKFLVPSSSFIISFIVYAYETQCSSKLLQVKSCLLLAQSLNKLQFSIQEEERHEHMCITCVYPALTMCVHMLRQRLLSVYEENHKMYPFVCVQVYIYSSFSIVFPRSGPAPKSLN